MEKIDDKTLDENWDILKDKTHILLQNGSVTLCQLIKQINKSKDTD